MRDRAVGYIRVSTQEQLNGGGLDIQREAIRKYVAEHGMTLVGIHSDEGVSGTKEIRPGLGEALARLEAGEAKNLVVYRLDRLARDLLIQETTLSRLQKVGVTVLSVTEEDIDSQDPTRVLVRQILGAIAAYEGALIRGRMAAGREAKRARDGWCGGNTSYGRVGNDGELVNSEAEMAVVDRACELRERGFSLRRIAEALTGEGFHPRRAERWSAEVVRSLVNR